MSIIISHSHYLHVAFVPVLVFQTFDRMIFGRLSFLEKGGTWWQYGAHKWYVMRKSLGTAALHFHHWNWKAMFAPIVRRLIWSRRFGWVTKHCSWSHVACTVINCWLTQEGCTFRNFSYWFNTFTTFRENTVGSGFMSVSSRSKVGYSRNLHAMLCFHGRTLRGFWLHVSKLWVVAELAAPKSYQRDHSSWKAPYQTSKPETTQSEDHTSR